MSNFTGNRPCSWGVWRAPVQFHAFHIASDKSCVESGNEARKIVLFER